GVALIRPAVAVAQLVQTLQAASTAPAADVHLHPDAISWPQLVHIRPDGHDLTCELVTGNMWELGARELAGQDLLIRGADGAAHDSQQRLAPRRAGHRDVSPQLQAVGLGHDYRQHRVWDASHGRGESIEERSLIRFDD